MPVVVTGADAPLGAAVVVAFLAAAGEGEPVELRATVRDRGAAAELIAAGVRTAVSGLDDPLRLGAVFEGAHTVVHLDDPAGSWDLLLEAAEDTGVRRLVAVVGPDAPVPAAPAYDLVVLRVPPGTPDAAVAAAVVAADRRSPVAAVQVTYLEVTDVGATDVQVSEVGPAVGPTGTVPPESRSRSAAPREHGRP